MALVDLHMHSNYSNDGEFTPTTLVEMAQAKAIKVMSITDHNSAEGVVEALEKGKELDVTVVPAIELDCFYKDLVFHVIGYFIDARAPEFTAIKANIDRQEKSISAQRVSLINDLGIKADYDFLLEQAQSEILTGEFIAEIVLADEDNRDNKLLLPYRTGGTRSDNPYVNFYWDFCAQGKPAYVHIDFITMQEALQLIHEMGALAVLAHPGNNLKNQPDSLLDEIVSLGIDGIEVYSSYHSPTQNQYFMERARELGIATTGGSDFHGKTKPAIHMGEYGYAGEGFEFYQGLLDLLK